MITLAYRDTANKIQKQSVFVLKATFLFFTRQ